MGRPSGGRGPDQRRTGSAIEPRTRYHTETSELQWKYISDVVTKSIVNYAYNAKSDGSRHSSIASHSRAAFVPRSAGPGPSILSTKIDDEPRTCRSWIGQA
jgi:hypothetical protein